MKNKKKLKIGISIGDINGIGVEVFLKVFREKNILKFVTPILFGSIKICSFYKKKLNINIKLKNIINIEKINDNKVNVINLYNDEEKVSINPGKSTIISREYAINSLKYSIECLKKGFIDALVTLPINKNLLYSKKFPYIGHTDYLKNLFGGEPSILMINKKLKILLFTDHVPLKIVSSKITINNIINKIILLNKSLNQDFNIKNPKIAILSFNPHSGDNKLIGNEEEFQIKPAVEKLFKNGFLIYGPYPADGFFSRKNYENFDAILAIYHDQGLIPFKLLAFNKGVNFTIGIPYIRTSPAHGVAYDIAGRGIANETSLKEAILSAINIYNNRNNIL